MKKGVAIIVASYLDKSERSLPQPSLRIVANRLLNGDDIDKAIQVLEASCETALA